MDRLTLFYLCFFTVQQAHSYHFTQGICSEGQVMCESGIPEGEWPLQLAEWVCIKKHWVCDGEADCGDGSDEKNCSSLISTVPAVRRTQHVITTTERQVIINTTRKTPSVVPEIDINQWTGRHEVPLFALRVGVKMKQLDSQTYLQAERLINQVLFEAQMGNITYFTYLLHCSKYLHSLSNIHDAPAQPLMQTTHPAL